MNEMKQTETLPTILVASVQPKQLDAVTQQLKAIQGITYFAPVTGRFDLVIQLKTASSQQVYEIVNKVRAISGVTATRTLSAFEGFTDGKNFQSTDALAIVMLKVNEPAQKILQSLRQTQQVYNAFITPGEFDVVATVYGRDYEQIFSQVRSIGQIQGISATETLFAYKPIWA